MGIEALVASAITILSPYVAAGATKAAEVAGEAVANQAGRLLGRLRAWFSSDREAASVLKSYTENPNRYGGAVEDILLEKAKADPAIASELQQIIESMGLRVEVIQKITTLAGQAVGLDLEKWEKGLASVQQTVDTVQEGGSLTGATIRSQAP